LPFINEEPLLLLYFTATMEFVASILITFGLFTRPVAFVLSGYMAVAYFWMHSRRVFSRPSIWVNSRCSIASYFSTSRRPARGLGGR
jgi:uncharacterized membrane protein YphA (DoxX/SURF4 family)